MATVSRVSGARTHIIAIRRAALAAAARRAQAMRESPLHAWKMWACGTNVPGREAAAPKRLLRAKAEREAGALTRRRRLRHHVLGQCQAEYWFTTAPGHWSDAGRESERAGGLEQTTQEIQASWPRSTPRRYPPHGGGGARTMTAQPRPRGGTGLGAPEGRGCRAPACERPRATSATGGPRDRGPAHPSGTESAGRVEATKRLRRRSRPAAARERAQHGASRGARRDGTASHERDGGRGGRHAAPRAARLPEGPWGPPPTSWRGAKMECRATPRLERPSPRTVLFDQA